MRMAGADGRARRLARWGLGVVGVLLTALAVPSCEGPGLEPPAIGDNASGGSTGSGTQAGRSGGGGLGGAAGGMGSPPSGGVSGSAGIPSTPRMDAGAIMEDEDAGVD